MYDIAVNTADNKPSHALDFAALPMFVVAGPCVIESADLCMTIAQHLRDVCKRLHIGFVFKASFDKANRSSAAGFRGIGMEQGLAILARVRREIGVPILTDVHEPQQAVTVAGAVDVLQVPAFLSRQTDLLAACGSTDHFVNVKKGQFMSPQEMKLAVEKVRSARTSAKQPLNNIWLTERGTFFGYNRLVNDFTGLPIMKSHGCPVLFDITHSTQQPAGLGDRSGGSPENSPLLARAAIAAGADGIFLECHPRPVESKSDAATMLPMDMVAGLLDQCRQIAELRKGW